MTCNEDTGPWKREKAEAGEGEQDVSQPSAGGLARTTKHGFEIEIGGRGWGLGGRKGCKGQGGRGVKGEASREICRRTVSIATRGVSKVPHRSPQ